MTTWDGNKLYYGYFDGINGLQTSGWAVGGLHGLFLKDIPAANVTGGSLHFYNLHTFNNSGGAVRVYIADNAPNPLPNTVMNFNSGLYFDVAVPKSGQVNVEIPLDWAKYFAGGGAANGLVFGSTTLAQSGYGYIDGSSVYLTIRYNG